MGEDAALLAGVHEPLQYPVDDSMLLPPLPPEEARKVEIIRGPNIKPLPIPNPPEECLVCRISLKAGDNITTDDITPASAEFSSMRSNIPLMSKYCYCNYDKDFSARAREYGRSIIIGGENYGQGSSREHAAINPMYLGVKAVIAKSFARIHCANLVNAGILPLTFVNEADYDAIDQMDLLELPDIREAVKNGGRVRVLNKTKDISFEAEMNLSDRQRDMLLAGGLLNYTREQNS